MGNTIYVGRWFFFVIKISLCKVLEGKKVHAVAWILLLKMAFSRVPWNRFLLKMSPGVHPCTILNKGHRVPNPTPLLFCKSDLILCLNAFQADRIWPLPCLIISWWSNHLLVCFENYTENWTFFFLRVSITTEKKYLCLDFYSSAA